ncbi:MAG TPA: hypothetical protein VHE61_04290 [Opitutaceae bacterium]|nr:hypothetical protein [Opitutaceae bacterium]
MNFSDYAEFKKDGLSYLLDARFHREDVLWDVSARRLRMECWIPSRDVSDEALPKPNTNSRNSWTKVRWSLENVASTAIDVTDNVAFYEIGSVNYQADSERIIIQGHYGVTITLQARTFAGQIEFLGDQKTDWKRA